MALIKIFYKTVVMLLSSVVLVIGTLTEGAGRLFGKVTEYLDTAHKWLVNHSELKIAKKKQGKFETK